MSQLFVLLVNVAIASMMITIVSLEDANHKFEQNKKSLAINMENIASSRNPRTLFKDSPSFFLLHWLKYKPQYQKLEKISTTTTTTITNTTMRPLGACICVPFYLCDANQTIITDGSGIIDFRIANRPCTGDLEVCCYLRNSTTPRPTIPPTAPPTRPPTLPPIVPPIIIPTVTPTPPVVGIPNLNCICVTSSLCDPNGIVTSAGEGIINPRQQPLCPANQVCCRILIMPSPLPTSLPPAPMTPGPTMTIPLMVTMPPGQTQLCFVCGNSIQCISCGVIMTPGGGSMIDPRFNQILSEGNICSATNLLPCQGATTVPTTDLLGPLKNPNTPQACYCVKSWLCSEGNVISPDGLGIIDPRFTACPSADQVCCRPTGIDLQTLRDVEISVPRDSTINGEQFDRSSDAQITCGFQNDTYAPAQPFPADSGKTYFAEFPWMVALLTKFTSSGSYGFQCGASMISNGAVLTAAHCVVNQKPENLVARFGQWNIENNVQPLPTQEANILEIIMHPSYYSGGLFHDVAVLILEKPVVYSINALPICLPEQGMTFTAGSRCYGIGWGSDSFGSKGKYQSELRKVNLPIVDRANCQTRLRSTKLGQYFQLHGSFICAGGEANRDTCRGDGGGPLVCQISTGQFFQVGIVSWGIGCGASNVPAVYASISQHRQWIDQQLATYGV